MQTKEQGMCWKPAGWLPATATCTSGTARTSKEDPTEKTGEAGCKERRVQTACLDARAPVLGGNSRGGGEREDRCGGRRRERSRRLAQMDLHAGYLGIFVFSVSFITCKFSLIKRKSND
ncbi:hypothetical protein BS78_05G268200 [Paspalum vaginatum]|nr:hypothetical protein BS78_05G268200 [Paspalum vaginatum]